MKARRTTTKIIWHCTATPEGRDVSFEDLWQWHVKERGWDHIGYHFLIRLDGSVVECRPQHMQGAHTRGENSDSVSIAYAGGVDKDMQPKDTRTQAQRKALYHLTEHLLKEYGLEWDDVYGHNQFAAKACPSFDVDEDIEGKIVGAENADPEPNMPDNGPFGKVLADLNAALAKMERRLDALENAQAAESDESGGE